MMRTIKKIITCCLLLFLYTLTVSNTHKSVATNTSVQKPTDSNSIQQFLFTHVEYQPYEKDFFQFYRNRDYKKAWWTNNQLHQQAKTLLDLTSKYAKIFSDTSLQNHTLNYLIKEKKEANETAIELMLTGVFFKYIAAHYTGNNNAIPDSTWLIPKRQLNTAFLLEAFLGVNHDNLNTLITRHSQYLKLTAALIHYQQIATSYPTTRLPALKKPIKKGEKSPYIESIRQRLFLLSDLPAENSKKGFDSTLFSAVKSFQRRMGLTQDGVIGVKMIEELNVPIADRILQIRANIERSKWMPPDTLQQYIFVNIPEYRLHVYDSSRLQFSINIVVGNNANKTNIFQGQLQYIVFSPYWNVPESIVEKEILPALKKDTLYLRKKRMEIVSTKGKLPFIRQLPGSGNSLGLVKFLFPNEHNIYFHDTPEKHLFSRTSRNLSHGCIRLQEPVKLANHLLRNDPLWTSKKIDSAMHLKKEKWVNLPKTVPVYLAYFTSWVDQEGLLNFRKDIYGYDKRISVKENKK